MLERLIRFSVERRGGVLFVVALLTLLGWRSFQSLPIDALPDVTNNQVQVNTLVEGLSPEEIERYITVPIENAMGGLAGLLQNRSISRFGLSQVTLVFEDNVDIYRARQMVSERLLEAADNLPANVQPKLGPITSGLGEIFHYSVESNSPVMGEARLRQLMELRAWQDWYVEPRLLTVPGVAEISTIGGFEKQFNVQPDIRKMSRYGLHLSDLVEALERTNRNVGGGYIQQTGEQFLVRATGLLRTEEDIRQVPIKTLETLRPLFIGDVAGVRLATELRIGAALVDGHEEVLGIVLMRLGENSREVAHRVARKVEEIRKGLPEGIVLRTLYDRSDLVDATLWTVEHNLLTGAALVILVLLVLLGNLRAALITAVTIPVTLLITFIVMKRWGISGNLMSLGALDFGIIVDGVVIVVDHCVRRLQDKRETIGRALEAQEVSETVAQAAVEIRTSAGFGELIILVVFLPIFALTGVEGRMFKPMVATFAIAVAVALVLSFTLAPALASLLLRRKSEDREPWLMRGIKRLYVPTLEWALAHRSAVLGLGLVSVIAGAWGFARLGGEFLPQLDEGSIVINCVRPSTISIDQSVKLQAITDRLLAEFPQVERVFSRLGTADAATDPMPIGLTDTFIMLKPRKEWPPLNGGTPTKNELAEAMIEKLEREAPGQTALLTQPIQMRFNELLEGTRADVSVKVFGEDMDTLSRLTAEMKEIIEKVPGAGDVELELQGQSPALHVSPRMGILKSLGISTQEVLEAIRVGIGGQTVGFVYENLRRFPIVVRLAEKDRSDLGAIEHLPVGLSATGTIPLSEAAFLHFEDAYVGVNREQGKRRAAILVNPRGRDTESFVEAAQAAVGRVIKIPTGYFVEWGGNFKNLREARKTLLWLSPLVLALVLFIVFAAFRNIWETALVLSCVPLALVGGVLGLELNGLPFSVSAGVGFVALMGIAVLNGVVLLNVFNDVRDAGTKGFSLIREGTRLRLRPVLMTALVDVFGFLPMMLATGVGAEVQRPLASVVIGGVLSSTLLTLVVLPVLVSLLEKRIWREKA